MARMMEAKLLPKPNVSPGVLQKLEEEDVKDAPTPGVSEPRSCCHYLISKVQPTTDQMDYNRPESLFKNTKIFSH